MNLRILANISLIGFGLVTSIAFGACNDSGTCPASSAVVNGANCTGDDLACAADIPITSCDGDGDGGTVASSCVCTKGSWVCPDPGAPTCEDASMDDAGDESSTDDSSTDDGAADGSTDDGAADGSTDDASADAPTDAPSDG